MGKALRFAPSRDGVQVASSWRIFAQGGDFYAAARNVAVFGKISFHPGPNWQLRVGTLLKRLEPPISLENGWTHALELRFVVEGNCYVPIEKREQQVALVNTPVGHNLVFNILWAPDDRVASSIPLSFGGTAVWRHVLRGGDAVAVTARTTPRTVADAELLRDVKSQLRVQYQQAPNPEHTFIEAEWHSFHAVNGNVIVIMPMDPTVVAVNPSPAT